MKRFFLAVIMLALVIPSVQAAGPINILHMKDSSGTAGVAISSTATMSVTSNTSGYTRDFDLSAADITKGISAYVSFSAVNSGTHTVYLQGSNDGTNYANVVHSSAATAATTNNNYNMGTGGSYAVDTIGDYAIYFPKVPPFKKYRWHVDADASNGPAVIDLFSVSTY